jgi:hypothetical protein
VLGGEHDDLVFEGDEPHADQRVPVETVLEEELAKIVEPRPQVDVDVVPGWDVFQGRHETGP